jgi:putative DNA primase/helicase
VKAFITSTTNDFRPPYGRKMMRALRHCLFVGTANEVQFLSGREGERRFWPITIPGTWEIPLDLVAQWRDQLWAEAVHLYAAGEQWWLTPEEKQLLRAAHQAHVERHPWEEPVAEWLAGWQGEVTTSAVLEKAIRKPTFQWNRADEMVVGRVLRALGYTRERRRDETGDRSYLWRKNVPTVPTSSLPEGTEVGT